MKLKRFITILRIIILVAAFLPVFTLTALAADGTWTNEGNYIEVTPSGSTYTITTAAELAWVAAQVNSGATTFSGSTISLRADIDLSEHYWAPIGMDSTNCFKGSFNGNNHAITGMIINDSSLTKVGFFGYVCSSNIRNIGIDLSINSSTGTAVGGLAGYVDGGSITNCCVTGSLTGGAGDAYVGGLAGNVIKSGQIINCYAKDSVTAGGSAGYAGGLVGHLSATCSIKNSYATGNVVSTGMSGYAGGLVAWVASGFITNSYATGNVSGGINACVGGLVGHNYYSAAKITNCYATGSLTGGIYAKIGGLVGENSGVISYGYWNSNAASKGIGSDTGTSTLTSMKPAEMQATAFIATLNTNVTNLNDPTLKLWKLINGINGNYPVLEGVGDGLDIITNVETPTINTNPADKTSCVGGAASLSVVATVSKGTLSYQWYSNTIDSNSGGTIIDGAVNSTYSAPADTAGTIYYYCVVTNTDTGATGIQIVTVTSETAEVKVEVCENVAPTASNVKISDKMKVGKTITGSYTYADSEGDAEGASIFKWYRADDAGGTNEAEIIGETSITYTLTGTDLGKFICFEVTPVALTGTLTGTATKSSYTSAVAEEGTSGYWPDYAATAAPALKDKTYTITTAAELAWVAAQVNGGNAFIGFKFILGSNIDLSDHYWAPIGTDGVKCFRGSFDGNGYKIFGLKIGTSTSADPSLTNIGLFGWTVQATINNVGLPDAAIYSSKDNASIGALVGIAGSSTIITNCYAAGSLRSTGSNASIGGLVGTAVVGATIKNSYATGSVTGGDFARVGGLVGYNYFYNAAITNSYATGSVTGGISARVGGLVGLNKGLITNSYATGSATGGLNTKIGGLVGDNTLTITNGYWNSSATGAGVGSDTGTSTLTSMTSAEMQATAFSAALNTNVTNLNDPTLKSWKLLNGINNNYPVLDGVGDGIASATNAEKPSININPADKTVYVGGAAGLSVAATVSKGTLSYQWYSNAIDSNSGGTIIDGAVDSTYSAPADTAGTLYYYCVVTNTDTSATGIQTATATSETAAVRVETSTLESIAITTLPNKLAYTVGSELDITGMVVTGSYSDNSTEILSITAANVTGFDSSKAVESQTLTVTVSGKTATYTIKIVAELVCDPDSSFSGVGIFSSPPGAVATKPGLSRNVTFLLGSGYLPGKKMPSGIMAFQFSAGKQLFMGTTQEWLCIDGNLVLLKGKGMLNGRTGYSYLLSAVDGGTYSKNDRIRFQIWDKSGGIVYDNEPGAELYAVPDTPLSKGNIIIKKVKQVWR